LEACPTGALTEPYRIDARRCISYLTIESPGGLSQFSGHRAGRGPCQFSSDENGTVPFASTGNCLFGCDACQEACPWNRDTPATADAAFYPGDGMNPVELAELASLDEEAFRRRFRHSPLWRLKREGILRNAEGVRGQGSGIRRHI
jgi:epoxyqueuosine reductase